MQYDVAVFMESKIASQMDRGVVAKETFVRAGRNVNVEITDRIEGDGLLLRSDLITSVVFVKRRYFQRRSVFGYRKLLDRVKTFEFLEMK